MWRQLQNGIHWCLLKPSERFADVMRKWDVPADCWPFTIEAAFAPEIRRQALVATGYGCSGIPQAELMCNPDLARRLCTVWPDLRPDNDAYWYLMAPQAESKEAFAAWITTTERCTNENYAAFAEIMRDLRELVIRERDATIAE